MSGTTQAAVRASVLWQQQQLAKRQTLDTVLVGIWDVVGALTAERYQTEG